MTAYTKLSDDQLIAFLKKDDQQAFTEIYNRYAESLAGFAASKLYNLDDARDILHDMFVKLWEGRDQLNVTSTLQSYLFAVIRHRIIDKIRKNITREEYAAMRQSLADGYEPGVEQQIAEKELKQQIQQALNELPPRVKEIYQLSREHNLTNKEIAEKLDLSEQTVKNQLSAALKHLRQSLGGLASLAFLLWWLS